MARAKRLEAEASRTEILKTAERHLTAGGPAAVKVQTVAAELGLSDAAIHYHFGNRQGLMRALLRYAGRNIKASLADVTEAGDIDGVAERLDDAYRRKGYARLALWLALEGVNPEGEGMYRPLVDSLHSVRRKKASLEDTQIAVALLNIVLIGEALAGEAIMAGVGLPKNDKARARLRTLASDLIAGHLDLVPAKSGRRRVARAV